MGITKSNRLYFEFEGRCNCDESKTLAGEKGALTLNQRVAI